MSSLKWWVYQGRDSRIVNSVGYLHSCLRNVLNLEKNMTIFLKYWQIYIFFNIWNFHRQKCMKHSDLAHLIMADLIGFKDIFTKYLRNNIQVNSVCRKSCDGDWYNTEFD